MSRSPLLSEYNRQRSDYACPLCGGHTYEGEPCGSCFLPFKVMESIRSRPHPPRFVVVLGPTGVGKTVYLGMLLDLLSRGVGGLQGLSRSPYSLTLHRNLILALQRQRFPEKTPLETDRWNWLHCEILGPRGKGAADIVTPDVAGEAVMSEMENPGTNKTIRALISRCAGMVVLVDLVEVVADGQSQELFAMQLISYLDALRREGRSRASWRCQWPLYSPRLISSRNGSAIPSCSRGATSRVFMPSVKQGSNSVPSTAPAWLARPRSSWTTRGRRAWSPCGSNRAGSSSRLRGWSASLARAVFRCIACAAALTPPPFARGGKSAASGLFPPCEGGTQGGSSSAAALPGSASRRLKIALAYLDRSSRDFGERLNPPGR